MNASGLTPDITVYDCLLKGFSLNGETEEIFYLLHKMAAKGIQLDNGLTSTILECICNISEDLNVEEMLPNLSQKNSEGFSIPCSELLMKLQKSVPKLQLDSAL